MKLNHLTILAIVLATAAPQFQAQGADSEVFSVSVPNFLIPIDNKTSTLDAFGDGSEPQVTGFNVLGSQRVFLPANGSSAGRVTLNIHLPGFDAAAGGGMVESLRLQISVRDMDFTSDEVYPGVFLLESAALTSVNGVRLQQPVNFMDLVPRGAVTDDQLVALNPLTIRSSSVPWVDFSRPQVLSFTFAAQINSRGVRAYTINNVPEGVAEKITYIYELAPVPEPSTLALIALSSGLLAFHFVRRQSAQ